MTHAKTPARPRRPREETARLGREMYERDILPQAPSLSLFEWAVVRERETEPIGAGR